MSHRTVVLKPGFVKLWKIVQCRCNKRLQHPKLQKTSELPLRTFQTIIVFVKHFYGESTLLTVQLIDDY
jgi:hypothetical protein